jgi:capsular exopolysaccharide synthesis family protein
MHMMDDDPRRAHRAGSWLNPPVAAHGAIRYLDTIRERWRLIVACTLISTLAALIYISVAPTRYRAEADVLVTPVSGTESSNTTGLGLITQSNDPTQTVSTAARLISTPTVAELTKARLGISGSAPALLGNVSVEPIAQSSLVAVQAESGSAPAAARLANGFAGAAVELATKQLYGAISAQLPALERQLQSLPPTARTGPGTLGERVATLQSLASAPNPTLRVASAATVPSSPSSPKKKLALIAGVVGGLIIGLGAAFASQALDPRLRREQQLRELFRLPLLTHVPRVPASRGEGPLVPSRLTPAAMEAYRTLRATVAATVGEDHRSALITSSSEGEGKSTAAINYAVALALLNRRVLLIEGDLRRPRLASALGVGPVAAGVGAVLLNQISMADAVVKSELGDNLGLLLVERTAVSPADRLSLPTARKLVEEAQTLADYVVIDSPPLTQVIDALPLAQQVDAVLIVARIGTSNLKRLANLGEILDQGGVTPAGIIVVGREHLSHSYYYGGEPVIVDEQVA